MKVLITGAHGQLGSEIKEKSIEFPEWNFEFTDVDSFDITNNELVRDFFLKSKPDFIVNCAAYTAVDMAETDIETAEKVNATAPEILAKNAKITGAKLIHISTDYVFNGKGFKPYTEMDMVEPQSIYGKTKHQGEINVRRENPEAIVIRTSWLYSRFGNNFVKTMMQLGKERDQVKVVFDQVGTPTFAGDLADAILSIIAISEKKPDEFIPGTYHFSNEGVTSWYDFAKTIFEITKMDCNVFPVLSEEFPTTAQRPNFSVLNKTKIKNTFNLNIPYWKDSLKICIEKLINT